MGLRRLGLAGIFGGARRRNSNETRSNHAASRINQLRKSSSAASHFNARCAATGGLADASRFLEQRSVSQVGSGPTASGPSIRCSGEFSRSYGWENPWTSSFRRKRLGIRGGGT